MSLKKIIAAATAGILLFALTGEAAAAPKTVAGHTYKDAAVLDSFIEYYTSLGVPDVESKLQLLINLRLMGTVSRPGDDVTNFNPNKTLTRWEYTHLYTLLYCGGAIPDRDATIDGVRVMGRETCVLLGGIQKPFSDVNPDTNSYPWLMFAYYNGLVSGYEDGTFRPDIPMTVNAALVTALVLQGVTKSEIGGWNGGAGGFLATYMAARGKYGWGADEYLINIEQESRSGVDASGERRAGGITRGEAALLFAALMSKPMFKEVNGQHTYERDGTDTFGRRKGFTNT
ncbi:MAG: S-layer homology domain-containing protein [Oscillospiraceae bacterium]|jgi:hypothetical protein|nr:S-layer homology domain-containing protein [Oscillospiraceae bacterium]